MDLKQNASSVNSSHILVQCNAHTALSASLNSGPLADKLTSKVIIDTFDNFGPTSF
jgi:hypothetical protein